MNKFLLLFLTASFLLLGCFEQAPQGADGGSMAENKTQPVVQPSFVIIAPEEDEVIDVSGSGGPVSVILSTTNFVIKIGGEKKFGEGHFVFVLDGGPPMHVYGKSYTFENVPLGEHTLYVELVHNDGSSYVPRVYRSLHFEVSSTTKNYEPATYTVLIKDFSYEPSSLEVNVGDTIVWVNRGAYPRSATCAGLFDSQMISPGKNATTLMSKAFECDFFSLNYPDLKGHIKVNPAPVG